MKILMTCTLVCLFSISFVYADSAIKPDEEIVFFPGNAFQKKDKRSWKVIIHGWVFEPVSLNWWAMPTLPDW